MSCFRKRLILILALLLLSLPSCGYVKRTQVKSVIDEARRSVEAGDFQKALDTYQSAYRKYPKDSETLKNYVETIESVKIQGDKAFDANHFAQAQITYELLLKNFPRFSNFAHLLSFKEDFLAARIKNSRMHQGEKQAREFLRTRDFQGGIDIYKNLTQQYPSDKTVRNRYVSLLESIKRQADLDLEHKDFAAAGRTYRVLLKNYSSLKHLKHFLSYPRELLKAGIETCRKVLFEEGLEQYRSGDLTQAISTWKKILTFDPENPEVKKATDKAIFQSKNLKKIKAGDDK